MRVLFVDERLLFEPAREGGGGGGNPGAAGTPPNIEGGGGGGIWEYWNIINKNYLVQNYYQIKIQTWEELAIWVSNRLISSNSLRSVKSNPPIHNGRVLSRSSSAHLISPASCCVATTSATVASLSTKPANDFLL